MNTAAKIIASAVFALAVAGLVLGSAYLGYRTADQKWQIKEAEWEEKLAASVPLAPITIEAAPLPVEKPEEIFITRPDIGDVSLILREKATLRPRKVIEVKSKVSGRILDLPFEAGAVIRSGSIIAEIAREEYERSVDIYAQQLERAQQAWTALLPFGELVTQPEKINPREMATLVDVVLINYGAAKVNYLNVARMYERNLVSQKALDDAIQAYDTAYIAYHQGVRAASLTLESAKVYYNQALESLTETTIRSPVSGVLIGRPINVGELAQGMNQLTSGTVIAHIADLSDMIAVVNVDERDVKNVSLGDPVKLQVVGAWDEPVSGRVESISPSGVKDEGRVKFEMKVALLETHSTFRAEMSADAEILLAEAPNVLRVPRRAVDHSRGSPYVTRLTPRTGVTLGAPGREQALQLLKKMHEPFLTQLGLRKDFEEETVEVRTGLSNDEWVEIVDGIQADNLLKVLQTEEVAASRKVF